MDLSQKKAFIDARIVTLEPVADSYEEKYGAGIKLRGYTSLRNALKEMRAESESISQELEDTRLLTGEKTNDAERVLIGRTNAQINARRRIQTPPVDFFMEGNGMVVSVTDRQVHPSMWLVHYAWKARRINPWGDYMRTTRKAHASFLCGREDGQDWAVRVPGTLLTIKEALHWITPSPVRKAFQAGKIVHRQGDMYFIPVQLHSSRNDLEALFGTEHQTTRGPSITTVSHPQHGDLELPNLDKGYVWRAVRQTQMSNYGERAAAD
jgi:hypothetical protein